MTAAVPSKSHAVEKDPDWKGAHWYPSGREIEEALPGFLLVVLPITVIAEVLWTVEIVSKQSFFVDIFMGAVLAVIVGNVVQIPDRLQPGLVFSTKWFLRAGIIIYGLKFSYRSLAGGGIDYLAVVLVSVIPAICGVAAAMATAPSVRAKAEEVGVALAGILFWGTLGLFLYPYIGHALGRVSVVERSLGRMIGGCRGLLFSLTRRGLGSSRCCHR